jgi:hypothetical protein
VGVEGSGDDHDAMIYATSLARVGPVLDFQADPRASSYLDVKLA